MSTALKNVHWNLPGPDRNNKDSLVDHRSIPGPVKHYHKANMINCKLTRKKGEFT